MSDRWPNQDEAVQFALSHPSSMMNMEMGTGKTRVAIDTAFERDDVFNILVVCPKAVVPVWRENLLKFRDGEKWVCWDDTKGTVAKKKESLDMWFKTYVAEIEEGHKRFVIINYDSVWRAPMGDFVHKKVKWDMVILDESHRAKAAGSKVSKFLGMMGKKVEYKMCLSGTPMANSPLDVYGQYRFLDPSIFGTNYFAFLQEYAILGGPERRFVVGLKNQRYLNHKFQSIAYTCKMEDIKDRIKLPDALPPVKRIVRLPKKDLKTIKELSKEFVAECGSGYVVVNNVLVKMLRMQQICSGFCVTQEDPISGSHSESLNTAKEDELFDILSDISPLASVVVFGVFRYDMSSIASSAKRAKRKCFEISGEKNELEEWKEEGGVLAVQIQAGAEGIDMTKAHHAVYFSLPHSLALYNQSQARLYRPGQKNSVSFIHLIAEETIDESMYKSLIKKKDIIESIKAGTFDFGYTK